MPPCPRKKRESGRGHDDKERPAIIAWVSRQGLVVVHGVRDFPVQTVQKAAAIAVQTGSRLSTDSASSYRALKGYVHDFVNHTQKEYARGDVHEHRAGCLFAANSAKLSEEPLLLPIDSCNKASDSPSIRNIQISPRS